MIPKAEYNTIENWTNILAEAKRPDTVYSAWELEFVESNSRQRQNVEALVYGPWTVKQLACIAELSSKARKHAEEDENSVAVSKPKPRTRTGKEILEDELCAMIRKNISKPAVAERYAKLLERVRG